MRSRLKKYVFVPIFLIGLQVVFFADVQAQKTPVIELENLKLIQSGKIIPDRIIVVGNVKDLEKAIVNAMPGDVIAVENGSYRDIDITISADGTKDRPILICPARRDRVILIGKTKINITGSNIIIENLNFKEIELFQNNDDIIRFNNSSDCRITKCWFENNKLKGLGSVVSFEGKANGNRLDNCVFKNIHTRSIRVKIDDTALEVGPPSNNRIDHNLFQDISALGQNGGETIQIGSRAYPYSDLITNTLIEKNIFLRCDGESEIISVKSSGNTIKNNKFLHCSGELSLRHGNENVVDGNMFSDCVNGVRISGAKHMITNNTIVNSRSNGIVLLYGTPDIKHPAAYLPVYDCDISGNVIERSGEADIYVGALQNHHWHKENWAHLPYGSKNVDLNTTIAPYNNRIYNNVLINKPRQQIKLINASNNYINNNHFVLDIDDDE